jgi:hypothetical protein
MGVGTVGGFGATAPKSILEEGLADLTRFSRDGPRLAVVGRDVRQAGTKGKEAIISIVNVDSEAGKREPAAGVVAYK